MPESSRRPVGVTVLGALHIVCGSAGMLAVVAGFVLGLTRGRPISGLPLELLAAVALYAFAGPVLGNALLKGRPWAWHLALFAYVLTAVTGWFAVPALIDVVPGFRPLAPHAVVTAVAKVAIAAWLALYLLAGRVSDFFGVKRGTRWTVLALAIVVSAAVLFGLYVGLGEPGSESEADASLLLQNMGERRANTEDDIRFMLERLEGGTREERVSAAWALGRSRRGDVIPRLVEASRDDSDVSVKINAIGAVSELGGAEVEGDLVGFLAESDPEVQAAALRGLAHKRFAGAVGAVGQFTLDNEALRGTAVDALGNMGSIDALPFLRQAATDAREDVRSRVAFAMGALGDRRAVPSLIEMLEDQRWTVRANAVQALGMIGDPASRPALEKMRSDPNSQVRGGVEAALQRLP
jgi:HEAT repeat protein